MSIAVRFGAASALIVFISIISIVILLGLSLEDALLPIATRDLERHAQLVASAIDRHLETARADTLAFRDSPLVAALSGDPDAPLDPGATARATDAIVAVMTHHPAIRQFRLIGAAGRERIRVDRTDSDAPPRVVPPEGLQDKGTRPYFRTAMELPPGERFVSRVELNREHGAIEVPHRPTMRVAAPVDRPDGTRFGVLVLNLDMTHVFEEMRAASSDRRLYLIDDRGDFLLHPDPSRTFATDLETDHQATTELPALTAALAEDGPQRVFTPDDVFVTRPWRVSTERLVLVEAIPIAQLMEPVGRIRSVVWGVGAIAVAFGVLFAVLVARSLARPLERLTSAVAAFADDDAAPLPALPSSGGAEVVALARTFEDMRRAIRDRNDRLEAQGALFRLIVDHAPYGMLVVDRDGAIVHANPAAAAIFGFTSEALAKARLSDLVTDGATADLELDRDDTGAPQRRVGRHHEGHELPLEVTWTRLEASGGWDTLVSVVDLTERERAAAWFARVVEATAHATVIVDGAGTITLVNRAAERLFGYERGALLGQPIHLLVPERARAAHVDDVASFIAAPAARPMGAGRDLFAVRSDGSSVPVEIGLTPIDGPSGLATIASITDLTERLQRESELQRSNAELEQFAYVASHDLQEPLRMVANYSELLARRYAGQLDERADKYIHYAVDGARRMQALVGALLEYSRVGSQGRPFERVDMNGVMAGVQRALDRRIRQTGGRVEHAALPEVYGDAVQLGQLFQNLIGNALKFRGDDPPHISVEAVAEQGRWRFAVIDRGIGIEPEYADRVFQMFQRLHPIGAYEGSGIGLAIAKRIVDRHGGQIWFEGTPGGGATFYVTLPRAEETA